VNDFGLASEATTSCIVPRSLEDREPRSWTRRPPGRARRAPGAAGGRFDEAAASTQRRPCPRRHLPFVLEEFAELEALLVPEPDTLFPRLPPESETIVPLPGRGRAWVFATDCSSLCTASLSLFTEALGRGEVRFARGEASVLIFRRWLVDPARFRSCSGWWRLGRARAASAPRTFPPPFFFLLDERRFGRLESWPSPVSSVTWALCGFSFREQLARGSRNSPWVT